LEIQNQTQGTDFVLPMAFESNVKASEIFVYCLSQTFSDSIVKEFGAVACVEITQIGALCSRIKSALPAKATFKAGKVDYYPQIQGGNPRWALPDNIGTSKLDCWASRDEYRFVFSLTGALDFEKVGLRLVERKNRPAPKPEGHSKYLLETRSLADICVLHDVRSG
jgi:hypothetical protein